jgi:DNA-binding beta-propeller fold protein YncE
MIKLLAALCLVAAASAQAPFRLEKTIPLPGVEGRFDHFAADVQGKRVFVAALGNNTLEALDFTSGARITSVTGLAEPQGLAWIQDLRRLYVANGKTGALRVLDTALKPAGEITFGEDADNVRYDAGRKLVWVGYGAGSLGAINLATGARAGDIRVDGHPESFQLEAAGPRFFVNVPNAAEIEVLDGAQMKVVAKWPVKAAAANYPMALDEKNHRLFAGCRKPARVLVFDTESGRMTTQFPCPGDTDDLFYDAARKRLYVAGGEGFIEAFEQKTPDEYRSVGRIATAPGARTALYVAAWSRLFVAVPHRGAQGAEIRIYAVD